MTSNGKQFTVTREMLTAVAGISARYSKFAFVLFCYMTNHLMTGPLGNSEFCFPRISMFPSTSSRETLRFSGNKIHCSPLCSPFLAKAMTSNGKQFTVTREMLTAVAGISARYSKFAFVLFCYMTNHLMTGPLGNSEFCFPRISMFPSTSSRETLRFSGNKIHCSPRDQSLIKCLLVNSQLRILHF